MKSYIELYLKHYDIGEQDVILCQVCEREAVDIHHIILKSAGGKDEIDNLIALCRCCHEKAHKSILTQEYLKSKI